MPKLAPRRIDFGANAFGLDFIKENGVYLAEVYSREVGAGPLCLCRKGDKIYKVRDGTVNGTSVISDYDIFKLDLSDVLPYITMKELETPDALKKLIMRKKHGITTTQLKSGEAHLIPQGTLHQASGIGILEIFVPSGYRKEDVLETEKINLFDFI